MTDVVRFVAEIEAFSVALKSAKTLLITAPGAADGDSIGAQLALRRMICHSFPNISVYIVNDEPLPERYLFLPDVPHVDTPESFSAKKTGIDVFDVAVIVDGGIDRAGRLRPVFEKARTQVFIDHHAVSVDYPYHIKMVDPDACATTELIYLLSQTSTFKTPVETNFAQQIYLGLIFDTGFFRHSNTTPESMELGAELLRTGFDFTRVGERGMLERTFASLQLLADTLGRAKISSGGKIISAVLTQSKLQELNACDDDREGIIDHLFLTRGIEVAVLFFELPHGKTKVSFRSQGTLDVAQFARSITERGGGHTKAAGAFIEKPVEETMNYVLTNLEKAIR